MISSSNRFHGRRAVSRVRGKPAHSPRLSARVAKNSNQSYRLAIVVSKKIDNRAVVRNRIRRRLFEAFRTQEKLHNLPLDVVVYVKSVDLATVAADQVEDEVASLTAKILNSHSS